MSRFSLLSLTALLLVACGSDPKTPEMVAFEQLYQGEHAATIHDRYPKLFEEANAFYGRAVKNHEDDEPEKAAQYTRLATITWKTGVALIEQKDFEDSRRLAEHRLGVADARLADATRRKAAAEDAVARQTRLNEMQAQLAHTEAKASTERSAAAAKAGLDAVALLLKEAEGMDAATHAPGELNKAQASLKIAMEAFEAGNYSQAEQNAKAASDDAKALIAAAKPGYERTLKNREIDDRLKALLNTASALPGVQAQVEPRGAVITLRGLFADGKVKILPKKNAEVGSVIALAKQFSEFRLVVEGHTDNRGNASKNQALSETRAQAVAGYMGSQGVEVGRMVAIGKGDSEPVADNSKKAGQEQNRRVVIVFLRPN